MFWCDKLGESSNRSGVLELNHSAHLGVKTSHLNTYFEGQTDLVGERRVWLVGGCYNSFNCYFWGEDMPPLTIFNISKCLWLSDGPLQPNIENLQYNDHSYFWWDMSCLDIMICVFINLSRVFCTGGFDKCINLKFSKAPEAFSLIML